jgi:hypothetical protein
LQVPGIECILTYKDVPDSRFTLAGQTYPEPSPYDRLILDQRLRYVGMRWQLLPVKMKKRLKKHWI